MLYDITVQAEMCFHIHQQEKYGLLYADFHKTHNWLIMCNLYRSKLVARK
jgi:hypothetical protein